MFGIYVQIITEILHITTPLYPQYSHTHTLVGPVQTFCHYFLKVSRRHTQICMLLWSVRVFTSQTVQTISLGGGAMNYEFGNARCDTRIALLASEHQNIIISKTNISVAAPSHTHETCSAHRCRHKMHVRLSPHTSRSYVANGL